MNPAKELFKRYIKENHDIITRIAYKIIIDFGFDYEKVNDFLQIAYMNIFKAYKRKPDASDNYILGVVNKSIYYAAVEEYHYEKTIKPSGRLQLKTYFIDGRDHPYGYEKELIKGSPEENQIWEYAVNLEITPEESQGFENLPRKTGIPIWKLFEAGLNTHEINKLIDDKILFGSKIDPKKAGVTVHKLRYKYDPIYHEKLFKEIGDRGKNHVKLAEEAFLEKLNKDPKFKAFISDNCRKAQKISVEKFRFRYENDPEFYKIEHKERSRRGSATIHIARAGYMDKLETDNEFRDEMIEKLRENLSNSHEKSRNIYKLRLALLKRILERNKLDCRDSLYDIMALIEGEYSRFRTKFYKNLLKDGIQRDLKYIREEHGYTHKDARSYQLEHGKLRQKLIITRNARESKKFINNDELCLKRLK